MTKARYTKKGRVLPLLLLALVVVAAALAVVWWLVSAGNSVQAVALQPQQLAALTAETADLGATEKEQLALLDALPQAVLDAGCDTLYFTVNTSQGIAWRDRHFDADPRLQREVLFGLATRTFDALDYLCTTCAQAGVQLVAVLDEDALTDLATVPAVEREEAETRLRRAVTSLDDYDLSGVVLRLDDNFPDTVDNRALLTELAGACHLPFGLEMGVVRPLLAAADIADTGAGLLVARLANNADAEAAVSLAHAAAQAGCQLLWKAEDALSFSAAAYYTAAQGIAMSSCVWEPVRLTVLQPESLPDLQAGQDDALLGGLQQISLPPVGSGLAIAYPQEGATVYTEKVFVMGTSDPDQPLTLNGEPVQRHTAGGTFGVLVTVEEGDNTFTFAQGGDQLALHLARPIPGSGGGGGGGTSQREWDDTPELEAGDRVQITEWICSVLNDPANEGSIKETGREGGIAVVKDCDVIIRGGKYSHTYELESGGWVAGVYCQPVEGLDAPWPLADCSVADDGRSEKLLLVRDGQALAYDNWDEAGGTLTVTLANTQLDAPQHLALASAFATDVDCEPVDGGVKLTFHIGGTRQLWGYDILYEGGNTLLYLRGAPTLALDSAQPLRGAVILLDAGHGGSDNGAMGIAGSIGGPCEKDVNLAVTLATRTRLQQMGATVLLTREGDDTRSLEERSRQAQAADPDLFLALHHNSVELVSDANAISGASAYYFTLQGKQLADSLLGPIAAAAGRENDGSSWAYFYVTRMTYAPAVLCEYGFLVNPAEYEACCDPMTILREGDATARGILDYFRERLQ